MNGEIYAVILVLAAVLVMSFLALAAITGIF